MGTVDKLINKALISPQNLRFDELCKLYEYFGFIKRRKSSGSSHVIYKRKEKPKCTMSIQDDNGKAKSYQIDQLLSWAGDNGLLKEEAKNEE